MKRIMRYVVAAAILAMLAGTGFLVLRFPANEAEAFETVPVSRGPIRKVVSSSGPVRALVTVSVGSQLSGLIKDVRVDFNAEVKAGDLLALLDERTFAAKVEQAKADLAAARAALANQEALLQKNEAVLRLAERTVERQRALAGRGIAAQSVLDTAVRDAETAKADIVVARANIENARAAIAQRQAGLRQAEIDLERTRITAPIDGTVISRTVDPGQTVAASFNAPELFKIAQDLRRIRIEAQVSEADIGAITEGNPVVFTVDAYPGRRFEGRVAQVRFSASEIGNVVTYPVIIEAANEDRRLFPGMTANAEIEVEAKENAVRIPNEALRFRPRSGEGPIARDSGSGQDGRRAERQLERLRVSLDLTEPQLAKVREAMKAMAAAQRQAPGGSQTVMDPNQRRVQFVARIEQVLEPLLSDVQRPLFERWKSGRLTERIATLWVLGPAGVPERRTVRLAANDDRYTEVSGGHLREGDRVIVRAR